MNVKITPKVYSRLFFTFERRVLIVKHPIIPGSPPLYRPAPHYLNTLTRSKSSPFRANDQRTSGASPKQPFVVHHGSGVQTQHQPQPKLSHAVPGTSISEYTPSLPPIHATAAPISSLFIDHLILAIEPKLPSQRSHLSSSPQSALPFHDSTFGLSQHCIHHDPIVH